MAFAVRNNQTILRDMIALMTALNPDITDYTEGGVTRSIYQTLATELERMDIDVFEGLKEAILTGTYKNFNFSKLPASFASGFVRVTPVPALTAPATINKGTRFAVVGTQLIFASTQAVIVPANPPPFVDVPVICQTLGSVGNVPAGTITQALDVLPFAATITNLVPFINGTDQESDADRQQRFQNYIAGLSKGTVFAIKAAAQQVFIADANGNILERAFNVFVVEPFKQGGLLGNINVYIDNGSGTASDALIAKVFQVLEGFTDTTGALVPGVVGGGVKLQVFAVIPVRMPIVAVIFILAGYDPTTVINAVASAIAQYIQSLQVGDEAVLNEITAAALSVPGTQDISYLTPVSNVKPTPVQRIILGILNITSVPAT